MEKQTCYGLLVENEKEIKCPKIYMIFKQFDI
jgi:hypothetical protein